MPAGIDRFARELIEMQFGGENAIAGMPVDKILALGAEDYEGGDRDSLQHGRDGFPAGRPRQRRQQAARSCLARDVRRSLAGLRRDRRPDHARSPTACTPRRGSPARSSSSPSGSPCFPSWRTPTTGRAVDKVPSAALWETKRELRKHLVKDVRERVRKSWLQRGASPAELGWVDGVLDPDVLTIGFARRVPTYKRLTLMLRDPERLKRLLLDPERPIQLVIAGKSHPADETGKKLIQEIVKFSDDPEVRHRIVFLPNYDIAMAQPLYPGCDVWLNNPLRPYEACGTSGMKAALNGGLNLSILDGWWDEWFDGDNGWAIPSADGVDDPDRRDDIEAEALYDLIETEVAPRFYDLDGSKLPVPLDRDAPAHAEVARPEGARIADGARLRPPALHAGRPRLAPDHRRRLGAGRAGGLEGGVRRGLAAGPDRARRVQRRQRRAGAGSGADGSGLRVARRAAPRGRRRTGRARPGGR